MHKQIYIKTDTGTPLINIYIYTITHTHTHTHTRVRAHVLKRFIFESKVRPSIKVLITVAF